MSEQGEEGQAPGAAEGETQGGLPPRPTVRESLRRGLFVRLPTEGESGEGLPGPEQPVASESEEYPGWRQTADGGWEPVSPEAQAYAYSQGYDPTPAEPYPVIDESANFASVAGGEPFLPDGNAWSFANQEPAIPPPPGREADAQETYAEPEPVAEAAPEQAPAEEAVSEPEPVAVEEVAVEEVAAEAAPVEQAPEQEAAAAPAATIPPPPDDPVAGSGLYIPADVELLEGDMPLYGENENLAAPMFENGTLGEPLFIEFGDLSKMLVGLRRLLPKGTRLTYNYDYQRAWVRASAGVDLASFAERVQASD